MHTPSPFHNIAVEPEGFVCVGIVWVYSICGEEGCVRVWDLESKEALLQERIQLIIHQVVWPPRGKVSPTLRYIKDSQANTSHQYSLPLLLYF